MQTFDDLKLLEPLVRAVHSEGYQRPTPIQAQAIPQVLEGKDLLGIAQTGTGKTAAFVLPILQRLHAAGRSPANDRPIRVLVLTPTRELAAQIGESFAAYGKHMGFAHTVIFGGVSQHPQERALRAGVDIVIATPGRLLDLISQRHVHLSRLEIFVLDEADRMLDMGFIHDVRKVIVALPRKRQTLLFSATMPRDIQDLASHILVHPVRVEVTPAATTVEKIDQSVYFVEKANKRPLLIDLLRDPKITRVLVFTRTKHGANRVVDQLDRAGIASQAIHGNKSQNARERALAGFKGGSVRVLVATDIAARGIDVEEISHVINYDLPEVAEQYVHRIGRTARAGAGGVAIAFCDREERAYLSDIERLIRIKIPVVTDHAYLGAASPANQAEARAGDRPSRGPSSHRGGRPSGAHARGSSSGGSRGGPSGGGRGPSGGGYGRGASNGRVSSSHARAPSTEGRSPAPPDTARVAPPGQRRPGRSFRPR